MADDLHAEGQAPLVDRFSIEGYRDVLADLDAQMRAGEPVVAHSTRHLIEARRPASGG